MTDATAVPTPAGVVRFPAAPNRGLTLPELADLYFASFKGRDRSRLTYLQQWCQVIGPRPFLEIDADLVGDALQAFASTPAQRFLGRDKTTGAPRWKDLGLRSPATLNRLRSALSALLRFARRRRLTPKGWTNPVLEVEALREDNARTRFLTPPERERLLRVARLSSWNKLHLLVLLALTTGARRGELLGLRYGDLDLDVGSAYVRHTKNGEPRVLPLTPAVVAEIRRLGVKASERLLFAARYNAERPMNYSAVWHRALAQAGIEDFRFHDLRHSCASYLAQNGASLVEIADVLGHRSLEVTRRYSHLNTDSKRKLVQRVLGSIGSAQAN